MTQLFSIILRNMSSILPSNANSCFYEIHPKKTQGSRTRTFDMFRNDQSGGTVAPPCPRVVWTIPPSPTSFRLAFPQALTSTCTALARPWRAHEGPCRPRPSPVGDRLRDLAAHRHPTQAAHKRRLTKQVMDLAEKYDKDPEMVFHSPQAFDKKDAEQAPDSGVSPLPSLAQPAIFTTMDITTNGFGFMLSVAVIWMPFVYSLRPRCFQLQHSIFPHTHEHSASDPVSLHVAQSQPDRVIVYDVTFVGMVLPNDELKVAIKHIVMRDGNIVIKIETFDSNGDKVIEGTAEVAQPTTSARSVWEAADEHLVAVYSFSTVEIVKDNPKEKTIHFGGIKGQAILRRYVDITYDTMDKDGNVKTLPLVSDINVCTQHYTFSHPAGLPFATQFVQIALVVTEHAAFEDMRSKGFVQIDSAFAGHSPREYYALAFIADVLAISSLVDVVFYLGITMQRVVEHDAENRSNYAMCAVNPGRISKPFNDAAHREVVNFNVEVRLALKS
ncbi:hypothetical protein A0H81_02829 [Grifola frondosa]|uniref:Malonyl-CoA:ACP transacylase (MAT) domain-containing protein n=1 Tax=Grifola frondosa TaxID=5627 RepID=A0A1C7ML86_GRIFR|nr:hypothetical protein A0H81_02829 [Grifola frondosa]